MTALPLLPFAGARVAFTLAIAGAVAMTVLRAASFVSHDQMFALIGGGVAMVSLVLLDAPSGRVPRAIYLAVQAAIAVAITFASRGHGSLVLLPVLAQCAIIVARRTAIGLAAAVVAISACAIRTRVTSWPEALAGTAGIAAGALFVTAFMLVLLREHRVLGAFTRQAEQLAAAHERTRIAREVHDILAHTLTAVHAQLAGALAIRDHDPARSVDLIDGARSLTEDALGDLRRSISDLHEHAAVPLVDRVRSLLGAIAATGTRGDLVVEGTPREDATVCGAAYRVIQESITNAIRHGAAARIRIELAYTPAQLRLVIEDDGRGADRIVPGFGLAGISDRIRALGGDLAITPRPRNGVRVEARLPLA